MVLLFGNSEAVCQDIEPVGSFKIDGAVAASLDRTGSLFTADKSGTINKYDRSGQLLLNYSGSINSRVSLIEAWSTLDILVFNSGFQQVLILNRFLTPIATIDLQDRVGFARMATFSHESNIWVIDDLDFSLRLIDLQADLTTIEQPLNQVLTNENYEFSYMREYQNLLFLVDELTGILVFDNLGNYLRTIPEPGLDFIGFIGDELYFSQGNYLHFIPLYSGEKRIIPLPKQGMTLVSKELIFILSEDSCYVYSY